MVGMGVIEGGDGGGVGSGHACGRGGMGVSESGGGGGGISCAKTSAEEACDSVHVFPSLSLLGEGDSLS